MVLAATGVEIALFIIVGLAAAVVIVVGVITSSASALAGASCADRFPEAA